MVIAAVLAGAALANPLSTQARSPDAPDLNDRGVFQLFASGKSVGTETFSIRAHSGRIEAHGEGHLQMEQNGKTIEVRTSSSLSLDPQLDPISYTWSQKGPQSSQLSVDFRDKPAHIRYKTVSGQDDRRDFALEKDVLVLDDNVIHHYQLAVARYERAKGGTQTLRAFIPQEALPGEITLNSTGPEPVTVLGNQRTLNHFILSTELAQISLWIDERGRLQMVSAPGAQFQAVRK